MNKQWELASNILSLRANSCGQYDRPVFQLITLHTPANKADDDNNDDDDGNDNQRIKNVDRDREVTYHTSVFSGGGRDSPVREH